MTSRAAGARCRRHHRTQLRRRRRPAHLRRLPAAARAAGPAGAAGRPAGPRRAAVHHRAPGLRAVVPAAAVRADAVRDAMLTGETWRARHLLRRVHVIERLLVAPGGRPGDDDPAGLPRVPGRPGAGQRLPVGAVPGAGVPVRRARTPRSCARFRSHQRRRAGPAGAAPRRAVAVGRVPATCWPPVDCQRCTDKQILDVVAGGRGRPRRPRRGVAARRGPAHPRRAGGTVAGRHVRWWRRQIGTKSGTGGSTGAPYLRKRVPLRYLPAAVGAAGSPVGAGRQRRWGAPAGMARETEQMSDSTAEVTQHPAGGGGQGRRGGGRGQHRRRRRAAVSWRPTTGTSPPRICRGRPARAGRGRGRARRARRARRPQGRALVGCSAAGESAALEPTRGA